MPYKFFSLGGLAMERKKCIWDGVMCRVLWIKHKQSCKKGEVSLLYKVTEVLYWQTWYIYLLTYKDERNRDKTLSPKKKKGSANLYYTLMFQHQTNLSYQDMLTHQALHPSLEIQMPQPQNLVISAIKNHSPTPNTPPTKFHHRRHLDSFIPT